MFKSIKSYSINSAQEEQRSDPENSNLEYVVNDWMKTILPGNITIEDCIIKASEADSAIRFTCNHTNTTTTNPGEGDYIRWQIKCFHMEEDLESSINSCIITEGNGKGFHVANEWMYIEQGFVMYQKDFTP